MVPMQQAEEALIDAPASDLLRPDPLDATIERTVAAWQGAHADRAATVAGLGQRAKALTIEIANLTTALAHRVAVASIAEALAAREAERDQVREASAAEQARANASGVDRARLDRELRAILQEWRTELRADVSAARPVLAKLLPQQVSFVPVRVNGREGSRLDGVGSLEALVPAAVRNLVPVRGFEPRSRG